MGVLAASHAVTAGIGARVLALGVGVLCVVAGWHFKLAHRAAADLRTGRAGVGRLKTLRQQHMFKAFWFVLALALVLFFLLY